MRRNPEETKQRIMDAATAEFARHGLGGARVDAIAERAGVNKRMLYHYFGAKDELYLAVLENAYGAIRRHESELELHRLSPADAVRELVAYTFRYFIDHPEFIRLLNDENLYDAEHIKRSKKIRDMHSPLVDRLRELVVRGQDNGEFRDSVDPIQLYVTIAGLGYFYLSNAATLSTIFDRDLTTPEALEERLDHAVEVVLGYLRK
jgi:AcrR family transcriptional regulator